MNRKTLAVLAILAAGAGAWYFAQQSPTANTKSTPAAATTASRPPEGIGALGRIEPRSRVISLSHDAGPEGARIEILHVGEGRDVKRGDLVATFSDYGRKEAKLKSARARVDALAARINAESANEQFYRRDFERATELVKTNAVSQAFFDRAQTNYMQTQARARALKAEMESAKADAALAEKELGQSRLLSPIDGTVLKINARPGERVGDGGVAEIADLTQMDVAAEIYERDMPRLKPGQQAEIRVPGMEEAFTGEVRELGFLVEKNDLNNTDPLADRDNRVVEVRISLSPETAAKLRHLIYMQVDVRLL